MLNADDPRVLSMRRLATGPPWLCSLDPEHPAIRDALAEGGRAMTVAGRLDHRARRAVDAHPSRPARHPRDARRHLAPSTSLNAMAAASAALAIGLPERAVVEGPATFVPDPERNPGRANLFALDGRSS